MGPQGLLLERVERVEDDLGEFGDIADDAPVTSVMRMVNCARVSDGRFSLTRRAWSAARPRQAGVLRVWPARAWSSRAASSVRCCGDELRQPAVDTAPAGPEMSLTGSGGGKSIMPCRASRRRASPACCGVSAGRRAASRRPGCARRGEADAEVLCDLSPGAGGLRRCEDLLPSRRDAVRGPCSSIRSTACAQRCRASRRRLAGRPRSATRARWARTGSEARS